MNVMQFSEPVAAFRGLNQRHEDTRDLLPGIIILVSLVGFFVYYLIPYVGQAIDQSQTASIQASTR